jgi:hypothetical protein
MKGYLELLKFKGVKSSAFNFGAAFDDNERRVVVLI